MNNTCCLECDHDCEAIECHYLCKVKRLPRPKKVAWTAPNELFEWTQPEEELWCTPSSPWGCRRTRIWSTAVSYVSLAPVHRPALGLYGPGVHGPLTWGPWDLPSHQLFPAFASSKYKHEFHLIRHQCIVSLRNWWDLRSEGSEENSSGALQLYGYKQALETTPEPISCSVTHCIPSGVSGSLEKAQLNTWTWRQSSLLPFDICPWPIEVSLYWKVACMAIFSICCFDGTSF